MFTIDAEIVKTTPQSSSKSMRCPKPINVVGFIEKSQLEAQPANSTSFVNIDSIVIKNLLRDNQVVSMYFHSDMTKHKFIKIIDGENVFIGNGIEIDERHPCKKWALISIKTSLGGTHTQSIPCQMEVKIPKNKRVLSLTKKTNFMPYLNHVVLEGVKLAMDPQGLADVMAMPLRQRLVDQDEVKAVGRQFTAIQPSLMADLGK